MTRALLNMGYQGFWVKYAAAILYLPKIGLSAATSIITTAVDKWIILFAQQDLQTYIGMFITFLKINKNKKNECTKGGLVLFFKFKLRYLLLFIQFFILLSI